MGRYLLLHAVSAASAAASARGVAPFGRAARSNPARVGWRNGDLRAASVARARWRQLEPDPVARGPPGAAARDTAVPQSMAPAPRVPPEGARWSVSMVSFKSAVRPPPGRLAGRHAPHRAGGMSGRSSSSSSSSSSSGRGVPRIPIVTRIIALPLHRADLLCSRPGRSLACCAGCCCRRRASSAPPRTTCAGCAARRDPSTRLVHRLPGTAALAAPAAPAAAPAAAQPLEHEPQPPRRTPKHQRLSSAPAAPAPAAAEAAVRVQLPGPAAALHRTKRRATLQAGRAGRLLLVPRLKVGCWCCCWL